MISVYLETSAFLRILFRQTPYTDIADFLEREDVVVVTSVATLLESRRAIMRARLEGLIKEGDSQVLLGVLAEHETAWQIIELIEEVQLRVGRPFPVEPVRTLDAIHLASALELKKIYPDLSVCSTDDRVIKNLGPLGLARWDSRNFERQ